MGYVNCSRTQILIACLNEAAMKRLRYLKTKIAVTINIRTKVEMSANAAWILAEKRFNGEKLNMLNILKAMVWKDVNVILNTSREIRGKTWFEARLAPVWEKRNVFALRSRQK